MHSKTFSGRMQERNGKMNTLVLIDFQKDFCDKNGPMYVKGAEGDVDRIASWIKKNGKRIDKIIASLDSHHRYHISNPLYWVDENGKNPPGDCSCVITVDDVRNGKWRPAANSKRYAIEYLTELYESGGEHRIWTEHCLIGSEGHSLDPILFDALCEWENDPENVVWYLNKGSHPDTEMFSIIKAQVPVKGAAETYADYDLERKLVGSSSVIVAGEASTHCVAESLKDMHKYIYNESNITLLKDATSPIPGLEHLAEKTLEDLKKRGLKVSTTADTIL